MNRFYHYLMRESDEGKVRTESELNWTSEMHRDVIPYRLWKIHVCLCCEDAGNSNPVKNLLSPISFLASDQCW